MPAILHANGESRTQPGWNMVRAPGFMLPVFKSPILLYRLGLGWLFGNRFMMLTHMGRRSHKLHRTILAVLRFDGPTKEIMAVSAWSGSDWYKNIQAWPAPQVQVGSLRYVPTYRTLTAEELVELFEDYRRKHPFFTRVICRIPGWKWDSTHEEFLELARTLRGIAFRPKELPS